MKRFIKKLTGILLLLSICASTTSYASTEETFPVSMNEKINRPGICDGAGNSNFERSISIVYLKGQNKSTLFYALMSIGGIGIAGCIAVFVGTRKKSKL